MSKDNFGQHVLIIKKCHICGHINESGSEVERCQKCNKSFLPSSYFSKVHDGVGEQYKNLYSSAEELEEKDLIIGIHVLW